MQEGSDPQQFPGAQDSTDQSRSRQGRKAALRRLAQNATGTTTELAPSASAERSTGTAAQPAPSAAAASVWRLSLSAGVAAQRRRVRLLALGSAALLVAVVVGALALHGAAGLPLPGLPGAVSLLPGEINHVYLDVDVPWATVTLDGRTITPPIIGKQPPLTLAPGTHHLRWTAAPFDPQSCLLSIPASRNDTCQLSTTQVVTLPHQPTAQLVYLPESLATLSTQQQMTLKQAIQTALGGYTAQAQPGESYIAPWHVANEPLRVSLIATLTADASAETTSDCFYPLVESPPCLLDGRDCVQLCTMPYSSEALLSAPDPHAWYAFALTAVTWSVRTLAGRVIRQEILPPVIPGQTQEGGEPVLLEMHWTGVQWSVREIVGAALPTGLVENDGLPIPDDLACLDAFGMLSGAVNPDVPHDHLASYSQIRFISGPNPVVGCLVEATVGTPGKPSANGAPVAKYLDRFGVVYALNSVDAPPLDIYAIGASAIQQQVAQSLSAYPGQLYVLPAGVGAGQ